METKRINKEQVQVTMTIEDYNRIKYILSQVSRACTEDSEFDTCSDETKKMAENLHDKIKPAPRIYKGWVKDRLNDKSYTFYSDMFNVNTVDAVLVDADGKEIDVHATVDHPSVSYGQPIWVDDKNNPICQCDMEEMAGYTFAHEF